jgi:hypothetical protein
LTVGEVFVECAEKTGFPGFGFFRQGNNYALRGRRRLPEGKMQLTGSKDSGWEYTDNAGESKTEISVEMDATITARRGNWAYGVRLTVERHRHSRGQEADDEALEVCWIPCSGSDRCFCHAICGIPGGEVD